MEISQQHYYIVNHMDEFLFEWSLCEYKQILDYLSYSPNTTMILSNYNSIHMYKDPKFEKENKLNISSLFSHNEKTKNLSLVLEDINNCVTNEGITLNLRNSDLLINKTITIPFEKICLLDFRAEKTLCTEDNKKFDLFLFGGILGDHPPRDRTKFLREKGYEMRHLGKIQMSTDTAVLTSKLIIENSKKFEEIPFIEEPEVFIRNDKGIEESVVIEGFRYVSKKCRIEDAKENLNEKDEPHIHETIKNKLLFKELDLNDFM